MPSDSPRQAGDLTSVEQASGSVSSALVEVAVSSYRRHSFVDWDESQDGCREVLAAVLQDVLRAARLTDVEITPTMIEAGVRSLVASGVIAPECEQSEAVLRLVLEAAFEAAFAAK